MHDIDPKSRCEARFEAILGRPASYTASAPGRIEVLGNHTDYNLGLTLSCAVGQRCFASIAPLATAEIHLASTADKGTAVVYPLEKPFAPNGHWANYILGLVQTLEDRGCKTQGFAMLIDSDVPSSAGLSSSSALGMSALTAIKAMWQLDLRDIDLAKIGQRVESDIVGAQTGLLDPLSVLLGRRGHLLEIDFKTLQTQQHAMPTGWCFVAVDSGVKHDLTQAYNQRRRSCEQAAKVMNVVSLREADSRLFAEHRPELSEDASRCARHVIGENRRVMRAAEAICQGDVQSLGALMFSSHQSSRDGFRNSCLALDQLVDFAKQDGRCLGARLSGGGFGGVTIHLVRQADAENYLRDLLASCQSGLEPKRWGVVCQIDGGVRLL